MTKVICRMCVYSICGASAQLSHNDVMYAQEVEKHHELIRLVSETRLVGRSGILVGEPFHAKFQLIRVGGAETLKVLEVNGVALRTPRFYAAAEFRVDLRDSDAYNQYGDNGVGHAWAWESGEVGDADPGISTYENRRIAWKPKLIIFRSFKKGDDGEREKRSNEAALIADQLGVQNGIHGRLGVDLGKWMRIRGRWHESGSGRDTGYRWKFKVLSINGTELIEGNDVGVGSSEQPIDITLADIYPFGGRSEVEPSEGQEWIIEAFEVFLYEGISPEVARMRAPVASVRRFGGYSKLVWRKLTVTKAGEKN